MIWRAFLAVLILLPVQSAFAAPYDLMSLVQPPYQYLPPTQVQGDQYIVSSPDVADVASPDQIAAELGYSARKKIKAPTDARLQILIDKANRYQKSNGSKTGQTLEMYLDGFLVGKYNASTGRETRELAKSGRRYFSSTPRGTYGIYNRRIRHWSNTWKAWMPYSQFLVGGIAIHATTPDHYKELGKRASGGCIRLTLKNAKTLWDLVKTVGVAHTSITIFDSTKDYNWMTVMSDQSDDSIEVPAKPVKKAATVTPSQPTTQLTSEPSPQLHQRAQDPYYNDQMFMPLPDRFNGIY
jgi:lipoprotein-anchoring transpeptidase ErfK/SrfK